MLNLHAQKHGKTVPLPWGCAGAGHELERAGWQAGSLLL